MKFCKDCKYFQQGMTADWCLHPSNGVSPVTGEVVWQTCNSLRSDEFNGCGLEAVNFEPKEQPKKKSVWKVIFGQK